MSSGSAHAQVQLCEPTVGCQSSDQVVSCYLWSEVVARQLGPAADTLAEALQTAVCRQTPCSAHFPAAAAAAAGLLRMVVSMLAEA